MNLAIRTHLALIGGLLGLIGTAILAVVLTSQDDPHQWRWWFVAPLIVATPYAVAIGGAFIEQPSVRGAWLFTSTLASLVFTVFLIFSAGIALLPATVVLLLAAGRVLIGGNRPYGWGTSLRPAGAVIATGLLIGSFMVLALSPTTTWCSRTIAGPDGSRITQSAPCDDGFGEGRLSGSAPTEGGTATVVGRSETSGVATGWVAGLSLALLFGAVLVLVGVAGVGFHRPGGGGAAAV